MSRPLPEDRAHQAGQLVEQLRAAGAPAPLVQSTEELLRAYRVEVLQLRSEESLKVILGRVAAALVAAEVHLHRLAQGAEVRAGLLQPRVVLAFLAASVLVLLVVLGADAGEVIRAFRCS